MKKSEYLKAVINLVHAQLDAECILCFDERKFACQNHGLLLKKDPMSENRIHLGLLVISAAGTDDLAFIKSSICSLQQDALSLTNDTISVTLLVHSREHVKAALLNGDGFFNSAVRNGNVMYLKPGINLTDFKITHSGYRHTELIKSTWLGRCDRAKVFYEAATHVLQHDICDVTLYQLVMAMEQICLGLTEIFFDYRSNLNDLDSLLGICDCIDEQFEMILPRKTDHDLRVYRTLLITAKDLCETDMIEAEFWMVDLLYQQCGAYIQAAIQLGDEQTAESTRKPVQVDPVAELVN
ncbi:hypothetical protein [Pedobacter metabolipauper]|uniref:HEPN domain-containing protein n=1 Tax=Pedobacter metabolipauper TaxID=425513 RepID=A0A4R6SSG0_9SPHI|nr:hypothetical protein [Pedobacter metabolipauper]TDQ07478.1 hypothetical protein ATK78_3604 [Pedobacter metabolipauper]